MRLDPEKIRLALAETEENIAGPDSQFNIHDGEDFSRFYHFDQLIRSGYIRAIDASSFSGGSYIVIDLTMAGHELLKKMRSDTVWARTKGKILELGGEVPLRVLEKLLDAGWDTLIP